MAGRGGFSLKAFIKEEHETSTTSTASSAAPTPAPSEAAMAISGRGRGRGIALTEALQKAPEETPSTAPTTAPSEASMLISGRGRGRGIALTEALQKAPEETPSTAPTSAPSEASMVISGRGRGRGIALTESLMSPDETQSNFSTSTPSVASTSIAPGGMGRGRGRSMFAAYIPTPAEAASSSTSGARSLELKTPTSTGQAPSGESLGALGRGRGGRGISVETSEGFFEGRARTGVGSSDSDKHSSEAASKPPSDSHSSGGPHTGAIRKVPVADPKVRHDQEPAQREPLIKKGAAGREFPAVSNSIRLDCDPNLGVFEYEVRFQPAVDDMRLRQKYLRFHCDTIIGKTLTFDGVILYLPKRLEDVTTLTSTTIDNSEVTIEVIYKRTKRLCDCIQLYNVLFENVYRELKYLKVGRKNFDPTAPQLIPAHKLEVWPGYVKAVDEMEGGLMLTLDVSHRVLSTATCLQQLKEFYSNNKNTWKEETNKALIGKMVLTRYNNRTYRVDDIAYDQSPEDTFTTGTGEQSYIDYYKEQYGLDIQDRKQPLIISRKEVLISGEPEKREVIYALLPELCYLTGLTDNMRANFTVMKDVSVYTQLTPFQRIAAYKKFLENVEKTPSAKEKLSNWGLSLDTNPVHLKARVLDEQKIIFGRGRELPSGPSADFSRHATSNEVLESVDMVNWLMVYVDKDKRQAQAFEETILKVSGPTGIRVKPPRRIELKNDRNETFVNEIRKALTETPNTQIVVVIFPSLRDDRYAAVKKILCCEIPVPSQVIIQKTLRNETKNRSIVMKILLQMNCKLGGTLWSIKLPFKKPTMICGIDTYHEAGHKGITVGGFVASLNPEYTRWWSRPTVQDKREELVRGLTASMEGALAAYKSRNKHVPDVVIIFRDGVGDGQLDAVKNFEIPQFREAFERFEPGYKPNLIFVIVQKRINTKFFRTENVNGKLTLTNPSPGSILDHTITSRYMYDYYVVAQHVRQGAATPSHYIVLVDDCDFKPDILQQLTFKLCFLYYNWPGTVRVPAPCQYAHKLADLTGQSIKRQTSEVLADKLFFL